MKRKVVLLAAILLAVTVPAATAGGSGTNKPVISHSEEKTDPPAGEYKLDFQELFGCKPMGEDGHIPMTKPASGVNQQETMQPVQKHDMQQKY